MGGRVDGNFTKPTVLLCFCFVSVSFFVLFCFVFTENKSAADLGNIHRKCFPRGQKWIFPNVKKSTLPLSPF